MKETTLQNYTPNLQETRWLRMWAETGRPLTQTQNVKTSADFATMKRVNVQQFRDWADALANLLDGQTPPKRKYNRSKNAITEPEADQLADERIGVPFSEMYENANGDGQ